MVVIQDCTVVDPPLSLWLWSLFCCWIQKNLEMATDRGMLQVTAGLLQLNGDSGKSSIWHSGQGSVSDGLALAVARHFKTTEECRNVIEKVKLAGRLSSSLPPIGLPLYTSQYVG